MPSSSISRSASAVSSSSLAKPSAANSSNGPQSITPRIVRPAHGGDNYCVPDGHDLCRQSLLPALPPRDAARDAGAWSAWANWQLVVALLPDRDTVNGERFDLRDIAPCVGTVSTKSLSSHVQSLYPNWEGRYRFMLKHILCVVKRYLRDGHKAHSRPELIRRVWAKFYGAKNLEKTE